MPKKHTHTKTFHIFSDIRETSPPIHWYLRAGNFCFNFCLISPRIIFVPILCSSCI